MYVCVCYGVTDSQIKQAVEQGADDYKSIKAKLNVGSQCGKCIKATMEMIEQTKHLEVKYYEAA